MSVDLEKEDKRIEDIKQNLNNPDLHPQNGWQQPRESQHGMKSLLGIFKKDFSLAITSDHVLDNVTVAATEFLTRLRGIILLPFITKMFGLSDYGIWVQCTVLSGILATLAGFNLHTYLVRHVAEENDSAKQKDIYISALLLLTAINIALMLVLAGLSQILNIGKIFLNDSGVTKYMLVAILSVPFTALQGYNLNYLRATQRIRLQGILGLILSSLELIFILFSLMIGGLMEALWAILIWRSTTSLIFAGILIVKNGRPRPQLIYMKEAWRFSSPLIFSNLSTLAVNNADKIIIGGFFGTMALGIYAVGSNLGGIILILITPFSITLLPKISKLWKKSESTARNMVEQNTNFFLLMAIPVIIFIIFFGKDLLQLFSKADANNLQTYITLIFISLGNVVWGLSIFETHLLYGNKNTRAVASIRIVTAVLNILLNYFLLKMFGIGIAAINLLLSHMILYWGYRKAARSSMRFRFSHLSFCLFTSLFLCAFIMLFNINMIHLMTMFPIGLSYLLCYGLIIYASSIISRKWEKT